MNVQELIVELIDFPMEAEVEYYAGADWLKSRPITEAYDVLAEDDNRVVVIR